MFTPIGFYAAAAGGFDPTLGGTLSVKYHWDFTDSSTMNLSGTDINSITDKVSSYTLDTYNTSPPLLQSGFATFGSGRASKMRSGANDLPTGMFSNNTFTIITLVNYVTGAGQGFWHLQSNQTNGWRGATYGGYRDSMPGSWDPELCNNYGSGNNVMMRWYTGSSNKSKYSSMSTSQANSLQLVGFANEESTNTAYLLYDKDGITPTYCSRAVAYSNTDSGDGFYLSVGNIANRLDYYHTLVYDELLSSAEMQSVWDAFYETQS